MIYFKNLLLFIVIFFPIVSYADCEKWINQLIDELHHSRKSNMPICKVWPADESKTIVVLPFPHETGEDDTYDLDVLLINSESGELIANRWQADVLISDAIRLDSFDIDTARYQLNPQTLAFGIRFNYVGSSQANPFNIQYLNLYVEQGKKLRQVITQLPMNQSSGEWDTNCDGEFETHDRKIILGNNTTNDYVDLIISEKSQNQIYKENDKGECAEQIINLPNKRTFLHYNGVEYPITTSVK